MYCISIAIGVIVWLETFIVYLHLQKPEYKQAYSSEWEQILVDPTAPPSTEYDQDIASQQWLRESPYAIESNTSRNATEVTVNFPLFLGLKEEEKKKFYDAISRIWDFYFKINIWESQTLDISRMQSFFWNLWTYSQEEKRSLLGIDIFFYKYPQNYYDFFQSMHWWEKKDIDIQLWLNGPYPYGFHTDDFIHQAKIMIERNNAWVPLKSFRLYFNGGQGISTTLLQQWEKDLQIFPAKSVWTSNVTISMDPTWYGKDTGRRKIMEFFKKSTPEKLEMDGFWLKENGWVVLYWF